MPNQIETTRRELLRWSAAAGISFSGQSWLNSLAAQAARQPCRHKSCILLWMDGGPSHIDTFDPKPDTAAEVRGEFSTIETSAPGIQITDRLSRTAKVMHHAAVLRGMSTKDNNHDTARILMHTGYKRTAGIDYPALGAIVSAEKGEPEGVMPNFVVTGVHAYDSVKFPFITSPGYLGSKHAALVVSNLERGVENLHSPLPATDFEQRLELLQTLENDFANTSQSEVADAHRTTVERAVQLMRSKDSTAFDLSLEPKSIHELYGDSYFGRGCLLARRLVEVGVPFVEVYLPDWDTHFKARVEKCHSQSLPQLDIGLSALVNDLNDRGLLDSTLVICMGEFGRTPKINKKAGRDHYSKAWTSVLFGGGIKGGQVVGRTDNDGAKVEERPVGVADFMATVCRILDIDYTKELTAPGGRPIAIVDAQDAKPNPIEELF